MPHKDHPLYPTVSPSYMEKEWPGLPNEVRKLQAAFKNPKLSDIEKELGNSRHLVGEEYPEEVKNMDLDTRKQLLKNGSLQVNGRKLYVTGGAVRNMMINHLHGHAHANQNIDLATDASPQALQIILNAGKSDALRNERVSVQENPEGHFHNINLIFQKGKDRVKFKTSTFPIVNFKDAPRMYLDYRKRNFTDNGLYYDVEKGHVIDHGNGLSHLAEKKVQPISGDMDALVKKEPIHAINYLANLASVNDRPSLDKETLSALSSADLEKVDKKHIADAFLKGIVNAIDKKAYIKLLNDTGLLQKMFRGMPNINTNVKHTNNKIPALTVAQLFKQYFASTDFLKKKLSEIGFDPHTTNDIAFLVKLPHYNDRPNEFTKEFGTDHFQHDRLHSNLSTNSIEEYLKNIGLPNANFIRKALMKPGFSDKHLSEPNKAV